MDSRLVHRRINWIPLLAKSEGASRSSCIWSLAIVMVVVVVERRVLWLRMEETSDGPENQGPSRETWSQKYPRN